MKKRIISTILVLVMILVLVPCMSMVSSADGDVDVWDGTSVSSSLSGSGTEEEPYLIQSAADLQYLRVNSTEDSTAGKYYLQTIDVDMNLKTTLVSNTSIFSGFINGNGHTINRLYYSLFDTFSGSISNIVFENCKVNKDNNNSRGLIGNSASDCTVRNVDFINCILSGAQTGLVGGTFSGTINIDNVFVSGLKVNGGGKIGGFLGYCQTESHISIKNCSLELNGKATVGSGSLASCIGYIANAGSTTILLENVVSFGELTAGGTKQNIAGLIGGISNTKSDVTIRKCSSNMTLSSGTQTDSNIGGFLGYSSNTTASTYASITIEDSFSTAIINSLGSNCGGLIGSKISTGPVIINRCFIKTKIQSASNSGGIIGKFSAVAKGVGTLLVSNTYNYSSITCTGDNAGGIVGYFKSSCNILNIETGKYNSPIPVQCITLNNYYSNSTVSADNNISSVLGYLDYSSDKTNNYSPSSFEIKTDKCIFKDSLSSGKLDSNCSLLLAYVCFDTTIVTDCSTCYFLEGLNLPLYYDFNQTQVSLDTGNYLPQEDNLSAVQLGIEDSFSLNIQVNSDCADSLKIVYECNTDIREYQVSEGIANGSRIIVKIDEIKPTLIDKSFTIKLLKNDCIIDIIGNYSIAQYCNSMLSKTAEDLGYTQAKKEALDQLMRDTLRYGEKAQLFIDENDDNLPVYGGASEFVIPAANTEGSKVNNTSASGLTRVKASGIRYNYQNQLYFTVSIVEETGYTFKVTILKNEVEEVVRTYTTTTEETIYTNPIQMADFADAKYTIKIEKMEGDTVADTYTNFVYGTVDYVKAMADKGNENAELTKAVYQVSLSAKAFKAQ